MIIQSFSHLLCSCRILDKQAALLHDHGQTIDNLPKRRRSAPILSEPDETLVCMPIMLENSIQLSRKIDRPETQEVILAHAAVDDTSGLVRGHVFEAVLLPVA